MRLSDNLLVLYSKFMATREEQIKKIQEGIAEAQRTAALAQRQAQADIEAGRKQEFKPGTATPIKPLPSITPAPQKGSTLVEFADVISQITDLARRKRQRTSVSALMGAGFTPGVVEPGTFASILQNLEQATQRSITESLATAKDILPEEPTFTGDIREFQDAKQLGLIDEKTDFFDYLKKKKEAVREPKGIPDEKETISKEEFRKLAEQEFQQSLLPERVDELYAQYLEELKQPEGEEFTSTEKKKLEQAGLLNARRQEQLDFLFGKDTDTIEDLLFGQ